MGTVAASLGLEAGGDAIGLNQVIHDNARHGADLGQLKVILGSEVKTVVEKLGRGRSIPHSVGHSPHAASTRCRTCGQRRCGSTVVSLFCSFSSC